MQHHRRHLIFKIVKFAVTLLLISASLIIFLAHALHHYPAVIDDAYISFRYSAHFASGKGLVYNPGDRTEGFSNFLWTLIVGIWLWLFDADALFFAKILGMLATAGLIVLSYLFSRLIMGRWHLLNFIPPLIIALNTYLAHWSVMGLETSAFVFLIFATLYVAVVEQKYKWRVQISPIIAVLAIMLRIDAAFFLGILLATFWAVLITRREFKLKRFALWVLTFAILFIPYMLWRWFYYHSIFPNPYYAKVGAGVGHSRGLAHLFYFSFTQSWGFINLWLVTSVVAIFWRNRYGLICLAMVLANAFYVWHVNGDWMPCYRFLLPVIPFVAINVVVVGRLIRRLKFLPVKMLLLGLLLFAIYDYGKFHYNEKSIYVFDWTPHRYSKNDKRWWYPKVLWRNLWEGYYPPLQNVADWILENVPDGAQVMTSDIGYPGYLNMGVRIIDIDGLTDRFIGRAGNKPEAEKKKQEYIMAKKPEFVFIFINHQSPNPDSPGYPYPEVSRLIYNSPEFKQDYIEATRMNKYLNSWVHLFKRKDTRSGLTPEEKISRLRVGIQRNPRMFYLYTELIKLSKSRGLEPETWLPYAKKAMRMFRGNAEFMRQLGNNMVEINMLELAQAAYRQSLKVNPRQPILYPVLADVYRRLGKNQEAIKVLKEGLKIFPNDYSINAALKRMESQP